MEADFTPAPHKEAVQLIAGKPVMVKRVFNQLLPELKARAFTVAGIESANCLQRIRDAVASVPLGAQGGQTWDEAKKQIVDELDPYLGDGADYRAELVLRTNSFQAYSASIRNVADADADTTHLQYLHGECEVPTPSHLALNGVTLPKDDPFWDTHTGPWGHLGCVCYVRPMNPDMVADEAKKDEKKNPEDRNVITGPALKKLNEGEILRNGQRHDVSYDGPDNSGFKWTPGDFKIPLKDLEKKYDPQVWSEFQGWAQQQPLNDRESVWDWLNGASKPAGVIPESPETKPALPASKEVPEGIALLTDKFKEGKFSPEIINLVRKLPPPIAPFLETLSVEATRGGACYSPSQKTIRIKRNPKMWSGQPQCVIHEIGHHLHYEAGVISSSHVAPEFQLAAGSDWKSFQAWAENKFGADWKSQMSVRSPKVVEKMAAALGYTGKFEELKMEDRFRVIRFTDTISGLSDGEYGAGHKPSYMRRNGLKEVFTHAWTALVDKDQEFATLFSGVTEQVRKTLNL